MANIIRWGITDGFRLAQTVGKELGNVSNPTPEEFIAAAERAKKKYPNEWVIHYMLADKYQQLGYYTDGTFGYPDASRSTPRSEAARLTCVSA